VYIVILLPSINSESSNLSCSFYSLDFHKIFVVLLELLKYYFKVLVHFQTLNVSNNSQIYIWNKCVSGVPTMGIAIILY